MDILGTAGTGSQASVDTTVLRPSWFTPLRLSISCSHELLCARPGLNARRAVDCREPVPERQQLGLRLRKLAISASISETRRSSRLSVWPQGQSPRSPMSGKMVTGPG